MPDFTPEQRETLLAKIAARKEAPPQSALLANKQAGPPSEDVQVQFVDTFIVGLLRRAHLDVKITRKPEYTTLRIKLRRAE